MENILAQDSFYDNLQELNSFIIVLYFWNIFIK